MAGANITKVPRWNSKRNLLCTIFSGLQITRKVVYNLGYHPRPINRVNGPYLMLRFKGKVITDRFNNILCVVKNSINRQIKNIGVL